MNNNKIIDIRTKARPIQVRDQSEIIEGRRKKRKEKIHAAREKIAKNR
ncbi:hypothetical protein IIE26_27015 (plasmid) [Cytobacillus oceanisediminis]|nr:hypothetical protein [Cytobacillus oceanisediminis]QOK30021.1 hypothetical protein IIE26_27015 [Cytobacillus oceanisediminis]